MMGCMGVMGTRRLCARFGLWRPGGSGLAQSMLHSSKPVRSMKLILSLLAAALAAGFLPSSAFAQAQGMAASPADLSQYQTADALWSHIQEVRNGPKTRPATAQEYQMDVANMVAQLGAATAEFLKLYPDDPRKWDVRLLQIETATTVDTAEGRPPDAAATAQLQQLAGESDAPSEVRGEAGYQVLAISLRAYMAGDPSVTSASILGQLHQFIAQCPTFPSLDTLEYKIAEILAVSDPAASSVLLTELADSGEGKIADQARKELAVRERLKSPLDLRFTAVDGSQQDLSKMRGKVVLVDFWATWSGPSRQEEPNVVAAYNKFHDKGLEVVGISLDQDRNSLLSFTALHGITWPQYFDGKGWRNSISSAFAVESLPTMWLVNKKGYAVVTNARADLEGQVEKLLAESGN